MRKCTALFYEFVETGTAKELGFETVDDLRDNYPTFYWHVVTLYIQDSLRCLNVTQKGKDWIAHLYSNVLSAAHQDRIRKAME